MAPTNPMQAALDVAPVQYGVAGKLIVEVLTTERAVRLGKFVMLEVLKFSDAELLIERAVRLGKLMMLEAPY